MQNTHEVAQGVAPESKIVYVDNDPLVLAHARALLTNTTPEGVTDYIDADFHDPDLIIAEAPQHPGLHPADRRDVHGRARARPDFDDMRSIVERVMARSRPAATCCCGTAPAPVTTSSRAPSNARAPHSRTSCAPEQLAECFDGPGAGGTRPGADPAWRPEDPGTVGIDAYGALGRKP